MAAKKKPGKVTPAVGNNGCGKPKGYISAFDMEQRLRTAGQACFDAADAIEQHRASIKVR